MDLAVVLAIALVVLGGVLAYLVKTHGERVAELQRDIESVEVHSRNVENENGRLKAENASVKADAANVKAENASLGARLKEREEAHAKLEQACAALEQRLTQLASEKEDLERRTRGFQGEWDRQMTTLEEEIQTVVRQLGEFRAGTKLPLPPAGPEPTTRGS